VFVTRQVGAKMEDLKSVGVFDDRRVSLAWQRLLRDPKLKVVDLAQSVGLSESRLEHLIAEYVGTTIRELKSGLKIERLHEARRQLLETNDTILKIRESAGYRDDSNFIHDFKNQFGSTPAACRRWEK
jgi:AraC-like DNA-binding protein